MKQIASYCIYCNNYCTSPINQKERTLTLSLGQASAVTVRIYTNILALSQAFITLFFFKTKIVKGPTNAHRVGKGGTWN